MNKAQMSKKCEKQDKLAKPSASASFILRYQREHVKREITNQKKKKDLASFSNQPIQKGGDLFHTEYPFFQIEENDA